MPNFSVRDEKITVTPLLKSLDSLPFLEVNKSMKIGKRMNENKKAKNIPATIILPKSITGLISLTPKEAKAIIVVKAV